MTRGTNVDARDRLIVALDVETLPAALELAGRVEGTARWVKVGLELFIAEGPHAVRELRRKGFGVMLDLKLCDIPETVARATARAADLGAQLLTVHVGGGRRMMESAAEAARKAGSGLGILGVTVLTSLDDRDLAEIGVQGDVGQVVVRRARLAMESGLFGVVASPKEAASIRAAAPDGFLIVTPGVRPEGSDVGDQKRVSTPRGARAQGADFVVVGRPIRDATDPRKAAEAIIAELA
ncbi:MAG: orotidine-5'-phosphate decarboxylase [Deltaproteobacteria bacterium]|nr:orotidine-5'-phosphate decarboxylase [Deltaproteobacteria bacterium]